MFVPRNKLTLLTWMVSCLGVCGPALSKDSSGESPFAQRVLESFEAWDRNHDGKLSLDEIEWWVVNPRLKGDDAIVMALLEKAMTKAIDRAKKSKTKPPEYTKDFFEKYGSMSREEREKFYSFDGFFTGCKKKMEKESRELFPESVPLRAAMHQGRIGDCALLAVLGSFVTLRPDRITSMMHGNQTEGYTVTFPKKPPVKIKPLTDAELAICGSSEGNGIWMAVMEKAVGEARREAIKKGRPREPTDALNLGHHDIDVHMELFTAHVCEKIAIPDPAKDHHKFEEAEKAILGRFARLKTDHETCASTSRTEQQQRTPPGMAENHGYAVLGYDAARKIVQVWNPWGKDFTPKGPEGVENGYKTVHGCFDVPVRDFFKLFRNVCFETKKPIAHHGNG